MLPKSYFPWVLLAISIVSGAVGQLFMKVGMESLTPVQLLTDNLASLAINTTQLQGLLWLALGILCYLIAVGVWFFVLKYFPLSIAYPLLSIGYILVYLGAVLLPQIGETFSINKTLGILLIMSGVALIAKPASNTSLTGVKK